MKESIKRITLIENDEWENASLEQACFLCGNKIEFTGFDFFLENVDKFICKKCASMHAPELIDIQENALFYAKVAMGGQERNQLFNKLRESINAVFGEVAK